MRRPNMLTTLQCQAADRQANPLPGSRAAIGDEAALSGGGFGRRSEPRNILGPAALSCMLSVSNRPNYPLAIISLLVAAISSCLLFYLLTLIEPSERLVQPSGDVEQIVPPALRNA